jgi:hypothetical protein
MLAKLKVRAIERLGRYLGSDGREHPIDPEWDHEF